MNLVHRLSTVATAALLCRLGVPAAAAQASPAADVLATPGAQVVPDSYVVLLKRDRSAAPREPRSVAAKHGAAVQAMYTHAVHGFAVTMTPARARALARDSAVASVQPKMVHRIADTQTNRRRTGWILFSLSLVCAAALPAAPATDRPAQPAPRLVVHVATDRLERAPVRDRHRRADHAHRLWRAVRRTSNDSP